MLNVIELINNYPYGNVFFPSPQARGKRNISRRKKKWRSGGKDGSTVSVFFFFFHLLFLGPFPFPQRKAQISSIVKRTQSRNAHMRIFLSLWTDLQFSLGATGTSKMDMAGSLTPHPDSDACNRSGRSMRRVTQAPSEVIIIRI